MKRLTPLVILPFLLATSGPLYNKETTGQAAELPTGARVEAEPEVWLGDNVNNQGCFVQQILDLRVTVSLHNIGDQPLIIDENLAELLIDGAEETYQPYSSRGETPSAFERHEIAPDTTEEITFRSFEVLSREKLDIVDTVELRVPTDRGDLVLSFDGLRTLDTIQYQ